MSDDPDNRAQSEDPQYRVYRAGESPRASTEERPYTVYRSRPRGLLARLRGEEDSELLRAEAGEPRDERRRIFRRRPGAAPEGGWAIARRVLKYVALAVIGWLLLSLVLFIVSAQIEQGKVDAATTSALSSGGNMLTSTDTVLIIGTDQRPKGTHEAGANTSDAGSRSDTIMLWRIGGGVSRRLSIPRDTVANIPGHGTTKINAAYAYGGAPLAIKTIEQFTGVKINHVIIVNLAAFPQFIDAIGGIDITTGRICSDISGGTKNGGFSLYLRPGTHHLNGIQALTLARTRHNTCNPAENDLTRVRRQQQILNAIKSKLLSLGTFFHLPWAAWDAPEVLRTDMGGFTLLSLFTASELGGSAPVQVLKPSGYTTLPDGESALTVAPGEVQQAVTKLMNG
ncbi:MAG TPA: LCP family protein [Solirubrobacteraceae bacterium]|nr:LCP family protein [Solirubrobacteraceae bacterium]